MADMLAVAYLVSYPIVGAVSEGRVPVDVTRVSRFGVYFCDAIDRFFSSRIANLSEHPDFDDVSDGEDLFKLIVHLSVCLRPMVHPGYYKLLRRYVDVFYVV